MFPFALLKFIQARVKLNLIKKVIKNLMVQHHPCRYKDYLKNHC